MKSIGWTKQLILAAALFFLGSFAYWLEYKHQPAQSDLDEQEKKPFVLKGVHVQSVRLTNEKKEIELKCLDFNNGLCRSSDTSKWEITYPNKLRADDGNANSLLSTLNYLNPSDAIDLKNETEAKRAELLKEYGLDPERLKGADIRKVQINTAANTFVLYLGLPHPLGDGFYAGVEILPPGGKAEQKVDSKKVYVIQNYFKTSIDKELSHWRDKKVFTLAATDVTQFELKGSHEDLRANKKDGQWTLQVGGSEFSGDIENVDNLLSATVGLQAKNFAADLKTSPEAQKAMAGSHKVLTLALNQGKTRLELFRVGPEKDKPKQKWFATQSEMDPLFEVDSSAIDRLDKGLKDLRLTKLITSIERYSTKRIEITGKKFGTKPFVAVNKDGKWTTEPPSPDVDSEKIHKVLDQLSGNRIRDFISGASIPTGESEGIRITLSDDKNPKKRDFAFWKFGDRLIARDLLGSEKKGSAKEAFAIDPTLRDALPWDPDYFKKTPAK